MLTSAFMEVLKYNLSRLGLSNFKLNIFHKEVDLIPLIEIQLTSNIAIETKQITQDYVNNWISNLEEQILSGDFISNTLRSYENEIKLLNSKLSELEESNKKLQKYKIYYNMQRNLFKGK